MAEICDIKQYRTVFFRNSLRSLYSEIASYGVRITGSKSPLTEQEIESRVRFFRRMKGQFIRLFRLKSKLTVQEVANSLGVSAENFERFEDGGFAIPDPQFFNLCAIVGAQNEVIVFIERIEEACQAGLRDLRVDLADALLYQGVVFADQEKYESEKGRIIQFRRRE